MGLLHKDTFICIDCESTGLEPTTDRIIEVGVAIFRFDQVLKTFETLINPNYPISEASQAIHNISQEMVLDKPTIQEVLPKIFSLAEGAILIGHGVGFDIAILLEEAKRYNIPFKPKIFSPYIDTLRLARLYGESPINSLEKLREHFNIPEEGAHRAMSDVIVNIEVFKYLVKSYKTTEEVLKRLEKPIRLKAMPLGKHKGRRFEEIPLEYLIWASNKDFDQDLLYSIRSEIKKRKLGKTFEQAANPFSSL